MNRLHLQIHLERSTRSIALGLPARILGAVRPVKLVLKLGLTLFALQWGSALVHEAAYRGAALQRHKLWVTLQALGSQLGSLENRVDQGFSREQALHLKFGITPPDSGASRMGVGGYVDPDTLFLSRLHPALGLSRSVENSMESIDARLRQGQETYVSLESFIEQKYTLWNHLPSISPCNGHLSSGFGPRTHPVTGEHGKFHYGIDISNSRWTPIYASADGVVDLVKWQDAFGNYVAVDHGNGFVTKYGHMEKYVVKEGQFVRRYQLLGYMGNTGRTTGTHLHYEVWINSKPVNPINYVLPSNTTVE